MTEATSIRKVSVTASPLGSVAETTTVSFPKASGARVNAMAFPESARVAGLAAECVTEIVRESPSRSAKALERSMLGTVPSSAVGIRQDRKISDALPAGIAFRGRRERGRYLCRYR